MSNYMPRYTLAEERFNMVSHIVGGGLGIVALLFCVIVAAYNQHIWGVAGGIVYGFSVVLMFTMSSLYHGLRVGLSKRVFRILDHCTIYVLIAGTYTPILLGRFREVYPTDAWIIFSIIWGIAAVGILLNAINLRKFLKISVAIYLIMGWLMVFRINRLVSVLGLPFFILILSGGILYTIGVIFYAMGKSKKYMHSVFHIFVVAASIIHSVAIATFIMP